MNTISQSFLDSALKRLRYYKDLGDKTLEQLEPADFYFQPNEESNTMAVIIRHVAGNMISRWTDFLTTDGEKDWRNRDSEFDIPVSSTQELLDLWEKGWACCLDSIAALTEDDLLKTIYIRKEPLEVIDAINRQLAHYPYHVGQMIYLAKMIKGNAWKNLSIEKGKSGEFNSTMGK